MAFKSDYLQLFQAQQITAAELLVAKEALSEARQDRCGFRVLRFKDLGF